MSDSLVAYWRSRADHYRHSLTQAEQTIEKLQEQLGDKNAVIASLKSRLTELENRCSQAY